MRKQKLALTVGGAISLVLVVATAVITATGVGAASRNRQEMLSTSGRLSSFYDKKPFPSDENIGAEEVNKRLFQEQYAALAEAVKTNAVVVEGEHSPGSFRLTCEETISALRRAAPKAESGESVIAPDFYFSFDRYDPSKGGIPAAKGHVPRLLRQLQMVDRLVRTLYAAEVLKIESVRREEFDTGAASSGGEEAPRRGGRASRRASSAADSSGFSLEMNPAPLEDAPVDMDRQRFGFVFLAREASLFATLNALNAMWPFTQVSGLQIVKTGPDVVFPAKAEVKAKDEDPLKASGIKAPPAGRTSRIVSGALREAPVKVQMTVDVFTFEKPRQESGAGVAETE